MSPRVGRRASSSQRKVLSDPNAHLVCLADWLCNRTLRNFLLGFSEALWADVVRNLSLLGVLCLRHLPSSPDAVWSSEDLARLVEYVQQEQRWPDELMPSRPADGQAWEPPWRQRHTLFLKPSPEWRQASPPESGRTGRRAFSAAHTRPIRGSHSQFATKIGKQPGQTRGDRAGPALDRHRQDTVGRSADASIQTVDVEVQGVSQSTSTSQGAILEQSGADWKLDSAETEVGTSLDSGIREERGVAEIASAFLGSDLRDAFRETPSSSSRSLRPPDAKEWRFAEKQQHANSLRRAVDRPSPTLDGCAQLHQPRLARGGWAVEIPMRSASNPLRMEHGEGFARSEAAAFEVDRAEPSSLEHGLSAASIASSSSSGSSRLGLGGPWVCSAGPLTRSS